MFEEIGTYGFSITIMQFEDGTFTGWSVPEIAANWLHPDKWQLIPDIRMDILGVKGRLWLGGIPANLVG